MSNFLFYQNKFTCWMIPQRLQFIWHKWFSWFDNGLIDFGGYSHFGNYFNWCGHNCKCKFSICRDFKQKRKEKKNWTHTIWMGLFVFEWENVDCESYTKHVTWITQLFCYRQKWQRQTNDLLITLFQPAELLCTIHTTLDSNAQIYFCISTIYSVHTRIHIHWHKRTIRVLALQRRLYLCLTFDSIFIFRLNKL